MKTSEIIQLTTKELQDKVEDERATSIRLKLNHAVSPLDSPMKIRKTRRLVARLLTELRKRELSQNS
jgi:large subunit ribosomal protein L29